MLFQDKLGISFIIFPKLINSLCLPGENELYPRVIFFKPSLEKKFSKGKNSPNGTRSFLLYIDKISNVYQIHDILNNIKYKIAHLI